MCIGQELGSDMKKSIAFIILGGLCFTACCADKSITFNSLGRFDYSKADDVIPDKATQLTWKSCSVGQIRVKGEGCRGDALTADWVSAKKLENAEWRLPTKEELTTLIDRYSNEEKLAPRIAAVFPTGDKSKLNYWTSDTAGERKAWFVNFGLGPITGTANKSSLFAVRLVKGTFVPPPPEIKPPKDIYEFIGRRDDCNHFAGEFSGMPSDRERDRAIDKTMTKLRCESVEADEKKLRKKYKDRPDMLKWLDDRPE